MPALGFPLASPFGGDASDDRWVGNVLPASGTARPASPITLSARYSRTDPAIEVLFSKLRMYFADAVIASAGTALFDALPHTFRRSTVPGSSVIGATTVVSSGRVVITKTSSSPQASVFSTRVATGRTARGHIAAARLEPLTVANASGQTGALLGLDVGWANKAIYLLLQSIGGVKKATLRGPGGAPASTVTHDWDAEQLYIIVWDLFTERLQVFAASDSATVRLFDVALSSIGEHDDSVVRLAEGDEVRAVYGVEGASENSVAINEIYFPPDVVPLAGAGSTRMAYAPKLEGSDLVSMREDPLRASIAGWRLAPEGVLDAAVDTDGVVEYEGGVLRLEKQTASRCLGIYRDDPDLTFSSAAGCRVRVAWRAVMTTRSGIHTGMCLRLFDGQTLFELALTHGASYVSCALRLGGDPSLQTSYVGASPKADWSAGVDLELEIDGLRNQLRVYETGALTALISVPFVRADLVSAADAGLTGATPFIAVGHLYETTDLGTLYVTELAYSPIHQAWRAALEALPTAASPAFVAVNAEGSTSVESSELVLTHGSGERTLYRRGVLGGIERGFYVDARVRVTEHKKGSPLDLIITVANDDTMFGITLLDSPQGKFCAALLQDGSLTKTIFGDTEEGKKYSFRVDWAQPHSYLVRAVPFRGLEVYLDYARTPILTVPLELLPVPPLSKTSPTEVLIGFRNFQGAFDRAGRVSRWGYIRTGSGTGYELGFQPPARLEGALVTAAFVDD